MSQFHPSIPVVLPNGYLCSMCVETKVESGLFNVISLIDHGGHVHGVEHAELDIFVKNSMSLDRLAARNSASSSSAAVNLVAGLDPQLEMSMMDDIASFFNNNNNSNYIGENDGDATEQAGNAEVEQDRGSQISIESASDGSSFGKSTTVVPQHFPNMATCDSCRKDGHSCDFIGFGKPCYGCKDREVCEVNHVSSTELWEKFSEDNSDKADLMVRFEEMFAFEEKSKAEDEWMAREG